MKWLRFIPIAVVVGALLVWQGQAQTKAETCAPQEPQSSLQYLRRMSLDLRGHLPSLEELQTVTNEKRVPLTIIDKMLKSQEFTEQIRLYHKDLLWANIQNTRFVNQVWRFAGNGNTQPYYLPNITRRRLYRQNDLAPCTNTPAKFDAKGNLVTTTRSRNDRAGNPTTYQDEGYVMVAPYWAPDTKIKVCAFDAQSALTAKNTSGRDIDCSKSSGAKGCGCGPGLRWCMTATIENNLRADLVEQTLRFVENIIRNDGSYAGVIQSREMDINGTIAHYLRYQTHTAGGLLYATPTQQFQVPSEQTLKGHERSKWIKVQRGKLHSGLLTMPLYLLKFASNRGRANRFYNAFLCSYFQAPPGGLPPASDDCHNEPNLMKRCGCKNCHQSVEPLASYWGRWAEAGLAALDPAAFPAKSDTCSMAANRNNATCRRLYFTSPNHPDEEQYRGLLLPYLFATPQMKLNIEDGPNALATKYIDNGQFSVCTTRKMWNWFVGTAPTPQQEEMILQLASDFQANNHNLRSLVRAIVSRPEYIQGRLLNR